MYKKQVTDNKCDRCINKFDIFQKKSPECEAEANLPGLFAANQHDRKFQKLEKGILRVWEIIFWKIISDVRSSDYTPVWNDGAGCWFLIKSSILAFFSALIVGESLVDQNQNVFKFYTFVKQKTAETSHLFLSIGSFIYFYSAEKKELI